MNCSIGPSNLPSYDPLRLQVLVWFSSTGECRSIPDCSSEELLDFPRRMREWLFNVMKELSDRRELSYHYQQLKKEAEVKGAPSH